MKNTKKLILNYQQALILYAVLFFGERVLFVIENPYMGIVVDIMQLLVLLYMTLLFLLRKYNLKKIFLFISVLLIMIISYFNCHMFSMVEYAIILFAGYGMQDKNQVRKISIIYFLLVLLMCVLTMLGIIPVQENRRGYSSMGFVHINTLATFIFTITCCYIIKSHKLFKIRHYLLLLTLIGLIIVLTGSRTAIIGSTSTVLFLLFFSIKKGRVLEWGLIRTIIIFSPVLFLSISLYLAYNFRYGNPFMEKINILTSQRLYMANNMMQHISPTLLGQNATNWLMENAYLTMIYGYGIIPTIIIISFYIFVINKTIKKKDIGILSCLLGFAVSGLTEGVMLELFFNISFLQIILGENVNECNNSFYADL